METKHIVKYSMGITSAVAASIVIEQYGKADTILLFNDTKEEAPDCYRFGREVANYLGVAITERSDGRSVSQVFIDEGILGNNRMTPCSRILKQEQGNKFIEELLDQDFNVIVYEGMTSPDDDHRLAGRRAAHAALGVDITFPLIERGLNKDDCKQIITHCWGIKLSDSYDHFDHDNCLNRGCVKGGLAYWGLLYLYKRDSWERAAAEEERFNHSILSTFRYGEYPASSLRNLLQRSIKAARKWERDRAQGSLLPLMNAPCICAA